jgi:hypothetical protein
LRQHRQPRHSTTMGRFAVTACRKPPVASAVGSRPTPPRTGPSWPISGRQSEAPASRRPATAFNSRPQSRAARHGREQPRPEPDHSQPTTSHHGPATTARAYTEPTTATGAASRADHRPHPHPRAYDAPPPDRARATPDLVAPVPSPRIRPPPMKGGPGRAGTAAPVCHDRREGKRPAAAFPAGRMRRRQPARAAARREKVS